MLSIKGQVEGWQKENYSKMTGIGDDEVSRKVIEQVYEAIMQGYAESTVVVDIANTYHIGKTAAHYIYNKAYKYMTEVNARQQDNLKEKQFQRLFKLFRQCEEAGDRRGMLAVLAEVNKLGNLYTEKVEITTNDAVFRIEGEDNAEED